MNNRLIIIIRSATGTNLNGSRHNLQNLTEPIKTPNLLHNPSKPGQDLQSNLGIQTTRVHKLPNHSNIRSNVPLRNTLLQLRTNTGNKRRTHINPLSRQCNNALLRPGSRILLVKTTNLLTPIHTHPLLLK